MTNLTEQDVTAIESILADFPKMSVAQHSQMMRVLAAKAQGSEMLLTPTGHRLGKEARMELSRRFNELVWATK